MDLDPPAGDAHFLDDESQQPDPCFFACFDKVQVKYEMLRAQVVDGQTASAAASAHGYSRAAFYLVAAAFERSGMVGLLDERPGHLFHVLGFVAMEPPTTLEARSIVEETGKVPVDLPHRPGRRDPRQYGPPYGDHHGERGQVRQGPARRPWRCHAHVATTA